MDDNINYYQILGMTQTASAQEIKSAYRKLARELHPDRWMTAPAKERAAVTDRFRRVSAAYTCLSDPKKKALYDLSLQKTPYHVVVVHNGVSCKILYEPTALGLYVTISIPVWQFRQLKSLPPLPGAKLKQLLVVDAKDAVVASTTTGLYDLQRKMQPVAAPQDPLLQTMSLLQSQALDLQKRGCDMTLVLSGLSILKDKAAKKDIEPTLQYLKNLLIQLYHAPKHISINSGSKRPPRYAIRYYCKRVRRRLIAVGVVTLSAALYTRYGLELGKIFYSPRLSNITLMIRVVDTVNGKEVLVYEAENSKSLVKKVKRYLDKKQRSNKP